MVQGEVGVHPVPHEMLRLARELADRHGALLVIDEIQTGLSRTGPLFAYQDVGVTPDVMCLAKSLGGGVPIGALVATPEFDARPAARRPRLDLRRQPAGLRGRPRLVRGARRRRVCSSRCGSRAPSLLAGLEGLVEDGLATEARGRGLMCAIDLPRARGAEVVAGMLERGFLVNNTSDRTIRMLPPLVVDQEDLDALVAAFREVLPTV